MDAEKYLTDKGIRKTTIEGVRLVGKGMTTHRIIELMEDYHKQKVKLSLLDVSKKYSPRKTYKEIRCKHCTKSLTVCFAKILTNGKR